MKSYVLGDDVLSQDSSEGVKYLLYDGHGSIRLLADTNGSVTDRYSYDAYGMMLGGNPNTVNTASTDLLYSGEQFDTGLQQQYLRARYYDQDNGRFNSLDPYSGNYNDPQSLHKYNYCHNNPVNCIDPTGEFSGSLVETIVSNAIQDILVSMVGLVLGPIANRWAGKLIPKWWEAMMLTATDESAYMFGAEASFSYKVAKVGGGFDYLYSTNTKRWAFYAYFGGGLQVGSRSGVGIEGYGGLVYNAATSFDYTKHFIKLTLPTFNALRGPLQEKMRMGLRNYLFKFLTVPYTKSLEKYVDINFSRWQKLTSVMQDIHKILKRVSVSIFRDPTKKDGAFGWCVGISATEASLSFGYSYYWQTAPLNQYVPFK